MVLPLFPELPEITEAVDQPTAADYALAARYALKRMQLKLAAAQAAAAMALDPQNRSHRLLLNEVTSAARDPLKLLELRSEGTFYGLAAARAWTLARKGNANEAVSLLTQVVEFRPNAPFLAWADEWRERSDFARKVEPPVVAALLVRLVGALQKIEVQSGGLHNLRSALALAEAVASLHPDSVELCAARCRVLRESGEPGEALALAESGPKSWATRVETALAQRDLRNVDQQIEALQDAIELRPEEASTHLDLGRALTSRGRLEEATRAFDTAKQLAPAPWSRAARSYLSWLAQPGEAAVAVLGAVELPVAAALLRDVHGYESALPDPFDRVVGVVRSALSRARLESRPLHARARIDGCPAPSARLAYQLGLTALGRTGELTLVGSHLPANLGGLWRSEGNVLVPSVEPPRAEVTTRVESLARTRFSWQEWTRHSVQIPSSHADELLAVAVHAPPPPPGADAVQWLVHVHTAIALLIASSDSAWADREATIHRALSATDDWSCNIGLVAWYAAAERDPSLTAAARQAYARLLPDGRAPLPCYARTLAILGMKLGGPHEAEWRALRARAAFSLTDD